MSAPSESGHLSNKHRDTLLKIFQHPTSNNIDWQAALSLLSAIGSVDERHEGKYRVRLKNAPELVLTRPRRKDLDVEHVVDVRRTLTAAGYDAVVRELEAKGKQV